MFLNRLSEAEKMRFFSLRIILHELTIVFLKKNYSLRSIVWKCKWMTLTLRIQL